MDEASSKNQAMIVFVLGLLGIVSCQILGPIAMIMGNRYLAECEGLGIEPEGLGKAGRVLGIVGTVLFALQLLLVIAYIGMVVVMVLVEIS